MLHQFVNTLIYHRKAPWVGPLYRTEMWQCSDLRRGISRDRGTSKKTEGFIELPGNTQAENKHELNRDSRKINKKNNNQPLEVK